MLKVFLIVHFLVFILALKFKAGFPWLGAIGIALIFCFPSYAFFFEEVVMNAFPVRYTFVAIFSSIILVFLWILIISGFKFTDIS